jgi:hypothetical protein
VRSYWLPNRLSKNAFKYFVLSLLVIIFTITIIHNIIIVNNDYGRLQDPIFCSKFSWECERIYPGIIDNLGTRSQKGSLTVL